MAEEAERQELLKFHNARYGKPRSSRRLVDYAEKVFLPWAKENKRSRNDETHIKAIKAFFKQKTFAEISPLLVEKFKSERRKSLTRGEQQRKPASVNRELACLSKIFSMAVRDGVAAENPCLQVKKLREENQRQRVLTVEEESKLLAVCVGERAHLRPILILAIHTGMRRGELLSLKWEQIDFSRGVIHLLKTKSGKGRDVPINRVVRDELLSLDRGSEWVFKSSKSDGHLVEIKKSFTNACDKAGITGLRFHDLRHTAATRMADVGVDPWTLAEILGHADLRMSRRYTHATIERKREAVEKLIGYSDLEKAGHNLVTMKKREA